MVRRDRLGLFRLCGEHPGDSHLPLGVCERRFCFGGSDAGWLDNITFPPYGLATYTVTPSAGANGSLNPATPQTVNHGFTTQFTVTPASNYHIDTVSGCGGSLVDSTYTTSAVTADCSVEASFAINQYTLTYRRRVQWDNQWDDPSDGQPWRQRHGRNGGAQHRLSFRKLERCFDGTIRERTLT